MCKLGLLLWVVIMFICGDRVVVLILWVLRGEVVGLDSVNRVVEFCICGNV